ncbi:unnamed protein product [Paramecium sonneborni]|uniref:Uncharacterized protein n=1 Tax=Paramecium sonneborni TaxID=65129 RepID=A0A8S1PTP5_9CILI|nr:unnamed protein product [Paramecium sonneborni]
MIKQSTIRFLFQMIYFSNFWNTFIAQYYINLSLYQEVNQIFFYLIMTILKIICPALSGFIIDHVQFTLNILFIGQWLTIVSYIYFLANILREIDDYLYFAIGFQILGQQLQIVIILTMISKHFTESQIPLQITRFYQYDYGGRILCSMIFFIQAFNNKIEWLQYEKKVLIIISIIPFVILLSLALCIYRSFPIFRLDIYKKIPELEKSPMGQQNNLLQVIKDLCKTEIILIVIAASSVMSIIQIWQKQLLTKFYGYFNNIYHEQQSSTTILFGFAIFEIPAFISIFVAERVGKKIKTNFDALQYLNDATSNSLIYFILSALQIACKHSMMGLQIFLLILTLIMQQQNLTILSISSTILIGVKKNQRTFGVSFGMLSMFTNLFEIWVICVLSQLKVENTILSIQKIAVIYGFAICYCILGATLAKMLQFVNQIKIEQAPLSLQALELINN